MKAKTNTAMNERIISVLEMIEKQERRISAQEDNFEHFKAYSVFYKGEKDNRLHAHEMAVKRMALSRLQIALENMINKKKHDYGKKRIYNSTNARNDT